MTGMFRLRILLAWLVAFALPLQGYAAVTAKWCDAPQELLAETVAAAHVVQAEQMMTMPMSADDAASSDHVPASHHDMSGVSCCHVMAMPATPLDAAASRAPQMTAPDPAISFES